MALGLSGGGDSAALLLLAADWARARGRALHAFVVNHGLQPGSAETTARAAAMAQARGVPARVLRWEGDKPGAGVQQAARVARHRLLAGACVAAGAHTLLLAHTLDDQAETVWLRLAAGSSWRGLAGMRMQSPSPLWPEGRDVTLLRPLLDVTRADLRALLACAGASWIEDRANADPRFARTRARAALNGDVRRTARLIALSRAARALAAAEDAAALSLWRAHGLPEENGAPDDATLRIPLAALTGPGAARLFRAMLTAAAGAAREPAPEAAAASLETVRRDGAATLGGAAAAVRRGAVVTHRDAGALLGRAGVEPAAPLMLAPGEAGVWDGRFLIRAGAQGARAAALGETWMALEGRRRAALAGLPQAARGTLPDVQGAAEVRALARKRLELLLFEGATWFDAPGNM